MRPKKSKSPKGEETSRAKQLVKKPGEKGTMEKPIQEILQVIPRKTRSQDIPDKNTSKQVQKKATPMQKPEVIDVDASPSTNVSPPIMQAVITLKKLFPELKATTSLMEYLFCIIKHPSLISDTGVPTEYKYVSSFSPFNLVSLFHLQNIVQSQLFKMLASRTLPLSVQACYFDKNPLKNVCRFHLCHMQQNEVITTTTTRSRTLNLEQKQIVELMKENFLQLTIDDIESMEQSLARGQVFYIFGFDNSGIGHHIIAALLYIQTESGSYINWFAVSESSFDTKRFGKFANGKPFCDMGIGTFLLKMVQLQAAIQNYSVSIYLQANQGNPAAIWYKNRGFELIANDAKLLPDAIFDFYQSSTYRVSTPYVHFVTTRELIKDLASRGLDPESEEMKAQYMNLMKLTGPLKDSVSSGDIINSNKDASGAATTHLYCCPANIQDCVFLKFPFNDTARHLNSATTGLVIFDNPWFKFFDIEDEMREAPNEAIIKKFELDNFKAFRNVFVSGYTYIALKEDIEKNKYTAWWNDETIDFFACWLGQDSNSPVVQCSEIVSTLVTQQVQLLFNFETINENAFTMAMKQIDLYLSSHLDILTKKFVFFTQNKGNQHWWGWAAINPWVRIGQALYEQDQEYSNHLGFISGLVPCDGMAKSFKSSDSLCFIWFLNLAAAYRNIALDGENFISIYTNHTPKSYWLLGCCGPYGIIQSPIDERVQFPILSLNGFINPKQSDGWNCGVIWLLFIYDIMMQAPVPYDIDPSETSFVLPTKCGIGKTWLMPKLFDAIINLESPLSVTPDMEKMKSAQVLHNTNMCKRFREEIVVCLERLCLLRLENAEDTSGIQKPEDWGKIPKQYDNFFTKSLKKHVQPSALTKAEQDVIKKERIICKSISNAQDSSPLVPADVFLFPSQRILSTQVLKSVLPQYFKGEQSLQEYIDKINLPFDKLDYFSTISTPLKSAETVEITETPQSSSSDPAVYASKFGTPHQFSAVVGKQKESSMVDPMDLSVSLEVLSTIAYQSMPEASPTDVEKQLTPKDVDAKSHEPSILPKETTAGQGLATREAGQIAKTDSTPGQGGRKEL